jgi:hypothetical protein
MTIHGPYIALGNKTVIHNPGQNPGLTVYAVSIYDCAITDNAQPVYTSTHCLVNRKRTAICKRFSRHYKNGAIDIPRIRVTLR